MAEVNAYTLFEVSQGLNMCCRKDCPSRDAHWLDAWVLSIHLISMENSVFMLRAHGPQCGVMVTCSRAGRGRLGMAPLLPFSVLRFLGFELIHHYCSYACLVTWSHTRVGEGLGRGWGGVGEGRLLRSTTTTV